MGGWKDQYGEEREKFYNRNGWGIREVNNKRNSRKEEENLEEEIMRRERDIQRQMEGSRIEKAKYNEEYKEIEVKEKTPLYLSKMNLENINEGKAVRALLRMRCGNMEEANKYWLGRKERVCVFCEEGIDKVEHYYECKKISHLWENIDKGKVQFCKWIKGEELDEKKG